MLRRGPMGRVLVLAALLIGAGMVPTTAMASPGPVVSGDVIVQARTSAEAAAAVERAHGDVSATLDIIHGVSAHVDRAAATALAARTDVKVVPDAPLKPTSESYGDAAVPTQVAALNVPASAGPAAGDGVTVALIDTGVADTPALTGDRLVRSPDLSGEGDGIDRYGHGTFMAGLIAGDGSGAPEGIAVGGVAPGARVVSVKVAGADGDTTLSRVLLGFGWVIGHQDDLHIGVISFSFGIEAGTMPYTLDPLTLAVEVAWASGITVVLPSGNTAGAVTAPGTDPYAVTVGATDTHGTADTTDDTVADWSGEQTFKKDYAKPELLAPGVSVLSLRAPGSTVDEANPTARVGDNYFRGSGTSMATAMAAGAAAVLNQNHEDATPDEIKGALVDGGHGVAGHIGRLVDVTGADAATESQSWDQSFPVAIGLRFMGLNKGMPWTAGRWTAGRWTAGRWTAGRWTAARWTAGRWTAARWTAGRWTAGRWTADDWTAGRWTAGRWTAGRWTAGRWTTDDWSAGRWTADTWD